MSMNMSEAMRANPDVVGGSSTSSWVHRADPTEYDAERSVMKLLGYMPTFVEQFPAAKELCRKRADVTIPNITYPYALVSDLYKDSYIKGVNIILEAIKNKQPIIVALDYDCDGVTAGACMVHVLQACGADVTWVVPNRLEEGYGLNVELVKNTGIRDALIVTVDNGITCHEQIEELNGLGYKTVITDHHLPEGDELPKAAAIINPKVTMTDKDEEYMVPGVYVAAKTALYVAKQLVDETTFKELAKFCTPLVAMGIVSDVIELNPLVRDHLLIGLAELHLTSHIGLKALLDACKIKDNQEISSYSLAFYVSPKINAAGRMGHAEVAMQLLMMDTDNGDVTRRNEALDIANKLVTLNSERKLLEQDIFKQADKDALSMIKRYKKSIVVYDSNWHAGVIGIIAARLAEKFGRATMVLTDEGDLVTGSGRSPNATFDLHDALSKCTTLTRYGGHAGAAGIKLPKDKVDAFREEFDQIVSGAVVPNYKTFYIDAVITLPQLLDIRWHLFMKNFEPHGPLNPPLVFAITGLDVVNIELKGQSIQAVFSDHSGNIIKCSKYRGPHEWIEELSNTKDLVDILVTCDDLFFTGVTEPTYRLEDVSVDIPF